MSGSARERLGRSSAVVRGAAVVVTGLAGFASHADAGTWSQTANSPTPDFNNASNWGSVSPVGAVNTFDATTNYNGSINVTAPISIQRLVFTNTSGAINFNLGGNGLTFTGTPSITMNAANTTSDVTFSGGGAINVGAAAAPFAVGSANSNGNKLTFTGAGTTFTGTATGNGSTIGASSGSNNTVTISNGAMVSLGNSTIVGSATLPNNAGNLYEVNGATLLYPGGARGITVHPGNTFRVIDGTASIPVSTFNANSVFDFRSGVVGVRTFQFNTGGPLTIGDGTGNTASLAFVFSGPVVTAPQGVLLKSDGRLIGNTGAANGIAGNVSGQRDINNNVTAVVAPSVMAGATMTQTSSLGTINVSSGNWDNSNIKLQLQLGNFPATLAAVVPPATFNPPADRVTVNGQFTLGGIFEVDLTNYVAPEDQDYEVRLVGWTSTAGSVNDVDVNFIGGPALDYEFRSDGFYVMAAVPEPATLSLAAFGISGLLMRRRRA